MSDTTTESNEETPALASDGLREQIVDDLRADLGEHLLEVHLVPQSDLWVRVAPEAWAVTAAALKAQGFEYFSFLSAIDWMPSPYGKGEDDPDAADDEPDEGADAAQDGGDAVISFGDEGSVRLVGINAAELKDDDFVA